MMQTIQCYSRADTGSFFYCWTEHCRLDNITAA